MTTRARTLPAKTVSLLTAILFAGQAVAQSALPPFGYRVPLEGVNAIDSTAPVVTPPTQPNNAGDADFDSPSAKAYGIAAIVGEPVSLQMTTVNGTAPITWLPGPSLIGNLNHANGLISGVAGSAGTQQAEFQAQDAQGKTARAAVSISILEPAIQIVQNAPVVRVGGAFSMRISTNVAGAEFALMGAPGMQRIGSGNPFQIGGTATAAGTYPVQVSLTKPGTSVSKSESSSVTVAPPLEIAMSAPIAAVEGPVSVTANVQNAIGATTIVATSGASQAAARGLSLSGSTLSGTLLAGPAATIVLRATDAADGATATTSVEIPETLATQASLVAATGLRVGDNVATSGPSNGPAITLQTTIPAPRCATTQAVAGLTVSNTCAFTGTLTDAGAQTLAIEVTPAAQPGAAPVAASATLNVSPRLAIAAVNPSASVSIGQTVNQSTTVEGLVGAASYELTGTNAQTLAGIGLAFDAQTGTVSGTVTSPAVISYSIRVRDSHDNRTASAGFSINASTATLTVASGTFSGANVRGDASRSYQLSTNIPDPIYSLVGAPSYVTVNASGLVTTAGDPSLQAQETIPAYSARVQSASDANVYRELPNPSPGRRLPALTLAGGPASGRGNVNLNVPLTVGGMVGTQTLALQSGSLPPGMAISGNAITGKPTGAAMAYVASIRVTDSFDGSIRDANVQITVEPALDFTLTSTASPVGKGTVGLPYSLVLTPQNVLGTVTFENVATPDRPTLLSAAGITIAPNGTVTGTPTAPATGTANIRMTETLNGVQTTVDKALAVAIAAPQTAAGLYPVASIGGSEVETGSLYDASSATMVFLNTGATLRLQFADPVTVNGIRLSSTTTSGSVTLKNVNTGQTFTASNFGDANNAVTQSTSDAWEVTTSVARNLATLRLTFGGSAPIAPSFTASSLTGSSYQLTGTTVTTTPSNIQNQQAPVSYSYTGDIPPGMSFDTTTGSISGAPTTVGTYQVQTRLTDARGISSAPMATTFLVKSGYTASSEFPVITSSTGANPEEILALLYDNDASSAYNLSQTDTLTFTFSQPVTVERADTQNQFSGYASNGTLSITAVDESRSFTVSNNGDLALAGSPAAATSKTWRITGNTGGHSFLYGYRIVLKGATARPVAPSFTYPTTTANYARGTAISTITPASLNTGSLQGTALTGTFQVIAGSLPAGLSVNPTTGVISGTPTTLQAPTNVTIAFVTTIPGVRSSGKTITMAVVPAETATNTIATVGAYGGLSSANASAALLDRAADTSVTLASNEQITFSFPSATLVNGFAITTSGTLRSIEIRDGSGTVRWSGTPTTGTYNWTTTAGLTSPNGIPATMDSTYTIRNTGGGPLTLTQAFPHYNNTGVAYPSIAVNASYTFNRAGTASIVPTYANVNVSQNWSLAGALPTGFTFTASNGRMDRAAASTAPGAESTNVVLSLTDGRGLKAFDRAIAIQVNN